MKKLYILILVFIIPFFSFAQQDSILFDFNNLQSGNLNGQNGWNTIDHTNVNIDFTVGIFAGSAGTLDNSHGVYYNSGGGGFGRTATQKSFDEFNLDFSTGGIVEIEADIYRNWWGEFIGIGYDADGDGFISPGLGSELEDDGIRFHIAGANFPDGNKLVSGGNSKVFDIPNSGWIRYRLIINLDANDGSGQGAMFYKVPPYDGDWIAITDIQSINLGLTPGSGDKYDPGMWNGLFFHAQGATAFFDNILIRRTISGGPSPQFIDFSSIEKQLSTTAPFELIANADSGLPVDFEVISGPASVEGNLLTLDGTEGTVKVKASQPGDGVNWAAAIPVERSFEVIDPSLYLPALKTRNPVDSREVIMPELSAMLLVASTGVEHPDVLSIGEVKFTIDGDEIIGKNWHQGNFTAYWTPPGYGNYSLTVTSFSSAGFSNSEVVNFEVVNTAEDMEITLISQVRANGLDTNIILPSFVGGYDKMMIYLNYDCPPEDCEPWDRIAENRIQGPTGELFGFMRYITPYGVACSESQDITDYQSLFQGETRFKFNYPYRALITLRIVYETGTPDYKYSWVDELWDGGYAFGNPANLQSVPIKNFQFESHIEHARLKLISGGHGWGDNNTLNAAEFYEATHNIRINGGTKFTQHLWQDCNPNPANCSPQFGTWEYDRAGWCPGANTNVYDYDLDNYLETPIELRYQFFPFYTDWCHVNNPNCISGVTCPNCNDGFNPVIYVDGHLVTYSNIPFEGVYSSSLNQGIDLSTNIYPNPNEGIFTVYVGDHSKVKSLLVYNLLGQQVLSSKWISDHSQEIDLTQQGEGIYWVIIVTDEGFDRKSVIVK